MSNDVEGAEPEVSEWEKRVVAGGWESAEI